MTTCSGCNQPERSDRRFTTYLVRQTGRSMSYLFFSEPKNKSRAARRAIKPTIIGLQLKTSLSGSSVPESPCAIAHPVAGLFLVILLRRSGRLIFIRKRTIVVAIRRKDIGRHGAILNRLAAGRVVFSNREDQR